MLDSEQERRAVWRIRGRAAWLVRLNKAQVYGE